MKQKLFECVEGNVFKLKEVEYDPANDISDPEGAVKSQADGEDYMKGWETRVSQEAAKEAPVLALMTKNAKKPEVAALAILSYFYLKLNGTLISRVSPKEMKMVQQYVSDQKFKELWQALAQAHY